VNRTLSARSALTIDAGDVKLNADLTLPRESVGLVQFVHGSGSSRFSSRNRYVAEVLNGAGFATLLADLLTEDEARIDERTAALRFNIGLLAERTVAMVDWALGERSTSALPIGLFGASTGAAAAIIAATAREYPVSAVVSRGGRVDLAGAALEPLKAPLLMIVGGFDFQVLKLHEGAIPHLKCEHRLEVVSGATHLFEEAGALERVAALATEWFGQHLLRGRG
jgi:putative phosphoribosyl transferase